MLIDCYARSEAPVNVFPVRALAGEHFTANEQQDASEFLAGLISHCDNLSIIVEHQLTIKLHCKDCGYTNTSIERSNILLLALPKSCKKPPSLSDLINDNLSHWKTVEGSCGTCKSKEMSVKTDISSANRCLIIQLMLFSVENGKVTKMNGYGRKAVPTEKIMICTKVYKVNSAIFHHGRNITEGHYTSMLREGTSAWVNANDANIRKQPWPRNAKDAYIFFLRQI
ncbi:uncharacterized protein LOC125501164 [Athalia rosae]|uniref:uncharacterized protein LOC125501164 n=1 Tax=Athalia rosae TaxID=37344 RepID=UPI00203363FC|nr:uncharacterized protein LOC125501164 [Athalia rosae]